MPVTKTQLRWLMLAGAAALLVILIVSTLHQTRLKYEVCVNFKGNSHCATATGATAQEAIHTAHDIDCELLSNGRDENVVCTSSEPTSVRQIH
jgi:hypothetical protein